MSTRASREPFVSALTADGPHPSLGTHADRYGRLIGSWEGTLDNHMVAGSPVPSSIEIHFAWALDGREVQDVWITPARNDRWRGHTLERDGATWRLDVEIHARRLATPAR
jgi:hypothetical protein